MISVIIPVYNVENYIERCVRSVLNQTYKDFEILLINDGSTDNSKKICEDLAYKHKQIKLINQENQGLSGARNTGIVNAKGNFLAFIDSDDFIDKNYLKILLNNLLENKADVSCCDYYRTTKVKEVKYSNRIYIFEGDRILDFYLKKECVSAWGKLYKKEIFDKICFPLGMIHEDIATNFKVFSNIKKIVYVDDKLYFYYKNESSITKQKFSNRNLDLIKAWNEVYTLSKKYSNRIQKLAEFRLYKVYFTLLGVIAYYGYDKSIDLKEQVIIRNKLLIQFRKYFTLKRILSLKYLSLNRKLAMILFKINYNLCMLIGRLIRW